jgi:crotonobetainyl-CoA:carnitine CoA-transferase CaiB-like acyl-CoA transferase
MSNLLAGIRVLESATLFNGDTLGAHLADLGADVIKVESKQGDYLRHFLGQIEPGLSPAHVQINRGKRSIVLDLKNDADRDVFWHLLDTADVFVDGNASDACDQLGIGYAAQSARKPDIVYCQYSGFGTEGPYAPVPTHGQMMDALAGAHPTAMSADGFMENAPHSGPMRGMDTGGEGTAAGAIHAAFHVAAALVQRERTGQGAFIDVAGTDGVIAQGWIAATYSLNEHLIKDRRTMPNLDNGRLTMAKYQYYEAADGAPMLFCCIEPKFWNAFCKAAQREDLMEADSPTSDHVDFGQQQDALRRELQSIIGSKTVAQWMALAAEYDFALGPAPRSIIEAAEDPHVKTRGVIHVQDHPRIGQFTYIGEAGRVTGQPYKVQRPAPDLGEHSEEIRQELIEREKLGAGS